MSNDSRKEDMLRMRREGATLNEIGKHYGVTRERIRQIIGTENKYSRHEAAAARAKAFIAENPRACWNEVSAYAGMTPEALRRFGVTKENAPTKTRYWTRMMLLDAGRRWRDAHGKYPTSATWVYNHDGYPAHSTVYRYFGSWAAYIEALTKEEENAPV